MLLVRMMSMPTNAVEMESAPGGGHGSGGNAANRDAAAGVGASSA